MKSPELRLAEKQVEDSLRTFETSLDQMLNKIDGTVDSIQGVVETLQQPVRAVRAIADNVRENYQVDSDTFILCVGLGAFSVLTLASFLNFKQKRQLPDPPV